MQIPSFRNCFFIYFQLKLAVSLKTDGRILQHLGEVICLISYGGGRSDE